jgi:hypothetical protein
MQILKKVDEYLESPHIAREFRPPRGFYPSQASCVITNEYQEEEIVGDCLRAVYWQSNNVAKTNPMKARSIRVCQVGKIVENFEVEQYKRIGIWLSSSVGFYNERYNLSGEVDAIIYDEDRKGPRGVEIKSGYDYKFRKEVIGTATRKGRPKFDHLMQTMLYIDHFKMPFTIVYIDRGNAARAEYDITLNPDGTPNIDNKKLNNGLSIPGCMARFNELKEYLDNGTLPKRDFQLRYSKEKIESLYDAGRLGKMQSKEFEKNKNLDLGDWVCGYCSYKTYCWKEHKE